MSSACCKPAENWPTNISQPSIGHPVASDHDGPGGWQQQQAEPWSFGGWLRLQMVGAEIPPDASFEVMRRALDRDTTYLQYYVFV